jgi:pimeloyl-CoA synthetase
MTHTVDGKIDKFSAIHSLVGGGITESDGVFTYYDGQTPPTEEAIQAEIDRLQIEHDNLITKQETDKANANQKLKDLGLTDDEITAITKG